MKKPVNTERWQVLEELFHRATEIDDSRRDEFLSNACRDDEELSAELKALLASAEKTLGSLKRPVEEIARQVTFTGRRIGPYLVQRLLSEGGMGSVFLAVRADEQYRQLVAIKVMHPGLRQSPAMLARFRTERQILASLTHANMARLLDGGVMEEGSPYLVMEFVDGTPIDEYCRVHNLSIRARLHLFRQVCSAAEYAHVHLVVHRDIKPENVLVTADGTPRLLDFGIAKLLDPETADELLPRTRPTERLMTPEYASPEQIRGEPITTATDVYGLGVLLYELLTGENPFARRTANPVEIARQICEVDPLPPSAIVSRSGETFSILDRELKGDLDQIVSMAMRKEPARRYASAAQLAGDVSAYLEGYPVLARKDVWSYRAAKFLKRHRLSVAAVTVIALSLVGFSVVMAWLLQRANRETLRAEREARFLADMFRAATPEEARGRTITARELLDRGANRIDHQLSGEPAVRASLLSNIAEAYQQLGLYGQAKTLAERSFKLDAQTFGARAAPTADSLFLLANVTRLEGHYAQAEPLFRQALEIREKSLGNNSTAVADTLSFLGECLFLENKDAEAESKLRRALEIDRRHGPNFGSDARDYLARLLERKGDYLEAAPLLREAVEIERRVHGTGTPGYAIGLHNLAGALMRLGDLFGAEAKLRESVAIERKILGNDHPDLGYALNLLGVVELEEGNWREAEQVFRECFALWSKLGQNHPLLATISNNWARVLEAKGNYAEANRYFQRALAIAQQPPSPDRYAAGRILSNLALLDFDIGDYAAAEDVAKQALATERTLPGGDRAPDTAGTIMTLAEARVLRGAPQSAEPALREALELLRRKFPPDYPAVIGAEILLGQALTAEGKAASGEPILRHALASAYTPPFPVAEWLLGEAQRTLGWCLSTRGKTQEAQTLLRESQAKLRNDPHPIFKKLAAAHIDELVRDRRKN